MTLRKLLSLLSAPYFVRALIKHRVAAVTEHTGALRKLGCQTVVDVGANRGQFALLAHRIFPTARIVSFEPLPGPARRFRSLFASDEHVTLYETAIGAAEGTPVMHVSARDDSSSLLPITARQSTIFPGTEEVATAPVRVIRLDQVLAPEDIRDPALLKIDVQGFELDVLRGCSSLLDLFDYVYCEASFMELYAGQALAGDIIAHLRDHGFVLAGVYNLTYGPEGEAVQGDFLFRKGETDRPGEKHE